MTLLQNNVAAASTTLAQTQAHQNFAANLQALAQTQSELLQWVSEQMLSVEWVFARDGALTALDEARWWGGCSLPHRAAQAMLAKLDVKGAVCCFLTPSHAAQIRVALDKLRAEQAVISIVPEIRDLVCILHCDDFSAAIASHRLWFGAGPAWDVALRKIFDDQCGLATPTQFIRPQDADSEQIEPMLATAQRVFSQVNGHRNSLIQAMLRERVAPANTAKVCVVAPSSFRIWNDLGHSLIGLFSNQQRVEAVHFDGDDPARTSPLSLLSEARQCGAILTANTGRTDLPGLLPDGLMWITWATGARIASSALAGLDDHLIVVAPAMREQAIKAGWPASRVHLGGWPRIKPFDQTGKRNGIGLIADTMRLDTPEELIEYSSHSLLWEAIRHELTKNPFVMTDPAALLGQFARRLGIGDLTIGATRFIEHLIIPAYQQGLVRTLLRAKLPVRLFGKGWDLLPEFKAFAAGPIESREQFLHAAGSCAGLIHGWTGHAPHPIDAWDVPILRRTGDRPETFVRDAQAIVSGKTRIPPPAAAPLAIDLIETILHSR